MNMQPVRFYDKLPTMECLQGDTLEVFQIYVSGIDSLEGCSMQVLLEDQKFLGVDKVIKDCILSDSGCFEVQLTSSETAKLYGIYNLHFRMKDAEGLNYRKLAGTLIVKRAVQG